MKKLTSIAVLALVPLLGCGGSSNTVTGTVNGQGLPVADESFQSVSNASYVAAVVELSSVQGACAAATACGPSSSQTSATTLILVLQNLTTSGLAAPAAGSFPVATLGTSSPGNQVTATWVSAGLPSSATSGSVTVSKIDASSIKGTFDLTFGPDHITGSFDAPICTGPDASCP